QPIDLDPYPASPPLLSSFLPSFPFSLFSFLSFFLFFPLSSPLLFSSPSLLFLPLSSLLFFFSPPPPPFFLPSLFPPLSSLPPSPPSLPLSPSPLLFSFLS
ncbi:hypothetical protein ACXWRS_09730, partial [Streptococcus pyogenes]